ncbi:MAG TPA: hypothetical protein VMO81_06795 [Aestuariivirgaceae bacterium]|nr:hypothetical protein [Aestuariivirgaceae bacterium]
MNVRRLAGVAAAALLLAFATPADAAGAGDTILAVTGKVIGGEMNLTLAEIEAMGTARMEIADKGPLFIVFPYDDAAEVRNALFYARSVWQIHSIEIE